MPSDDAQMNPLAGILTPQSLAMLRFQQMQNMYQQAGQLNGAGYAARVAGMNAGQQLSNLNGPSNSGIDQFAAQNQQDIDSSMAGPPSAQQVGTAPLSPLEAQARKFETLAQKLRDRGLTANAVDMQDKANTLRTADANMAKTQAETDEAGAKAVQARAEAEKAGRFSVWRKSLDQSGVAPNKTQWEDINGYERPQVLDTGNEPDWTLQDRNTPTGVQSVLINKHGDSIIIPQPGERPYNGVVFQGIAKDLEGKIRTLNLGRSALAKADPYLNRAVGFQASAAREGGGFLNLFTPGATNPQVTEATASVDSANQLARAALRVTGRYSNSQDKDIADMLPSSEGAFKNPQAERDKLWGTEAQLANEEQRLRDQYTAIMGSDKGLPDRLPVLRDADAAKVKALQERRRLQPAPVTVESPPAQQQAQPPVPANVPLAGPGMSAPNPRGANGRPPGMTAQPEDNQPATERPASERRTVTVNGKPVAYTVHY